MTKTFSAVAQLSTQVEHGALLVTVLGTNGIPLTGFKNLPSLVTLMRTHEALQTEFWRVSVPGLAKTQRGYVCLHDVALDDDNDFEKVGGYFASAAINFEAPSKEDVDAQLTSTKGNGPWSSSGSAPVNIYPVKPSRTFIFGKRALGEELAEQTITISTQEVAARIAGDWSRLTSLVIKTLDSVVTEPAQPVSDPGVTFALLGPQEGSRAVCSVTGLKTGVYIVRMTCTLDNGEKISGKGTLEII